MSMSKRAPRNNSDGICAEMWKIVATGGWWTAAEIAEVLPPKYRGRISDHLWSMVNRCNQLVTRGQKLKREYAVTASCEAPNGVTVGQLSQILLGKSMPGEIITLPVTNPQEAVHGPAGAPSLGNNVALLRPGRDSVKKRAA